MKNLLKLSGVAIASIVIVGCGSSSSSNSSNTGTGYYEDGAIVGVDYKCGNQTGVTGDNGVFVFDINKSCTFSIGDVTLETKPSSLFTSKNKVSVRVSDDKVKEILAFLDIDGNLNNGFKIDTDAAKEALKEANITKIDSNITNKLSNIANKYENKLKEKGYTKYKVQTEEDVQKNLEKHQKEQLKNILAGNTYYLPIEKDWDENSNKPIMTVGEVNFDNNFKKATWKKDKNDTETFDFNVTDGKLVTENEEIELIAYNDKSITLAEYYYIFTAVDGQQLTSKPYIMTLYKNKADAEKKAKEIEGYYNITEDKVKALVGTTLYKAHVLCDNSIEMSKLEIKKDKILYTKNNETKSTTYEIDNDKIVLKDGNKTKTQQIVYISDKKVIIKVGSGNDSYDDYRTFYKTENLAKEHAHPYYGQPCNQNNQDYNNQSGGNQNNNDNGNSNMNNNQDDNNQSGGSQSNDNGNSNMNNNQNSDNQEVPTSPITINENNIRSHMLGKTLYIKDGNKLKSLTLNNNNTYVYKENGTVKDSGNISVSGDKITADHAQKTLQVVYLSNEKVGLKDADDQETDYWYFNQNDAENNSDN